MRYLKLENVAVLRRLKKANTFKLSVALRAKMPSFNFEYNFSMNEAFMLFVFLDE